MNTAMYLIRHGEVNNPIGLFYGRSRDVSLSERGQMQAVSLGETLSRRKIHLEAIYTSPLSRTRRTAQLLSETLGNTPIFQSDSLVEVDSHGFEGKPISFLSELGDYYANAPKGVSIESPEAIAQRMQEEIQRLRKMYEGKAIAIVSHGDTLAFAIDRMLHPDTPLRAITELFKDSYPAQGDARAILLNENDMVIHQELIKGDRIHISKESE